MFVNSWKVCRPRRFVVLQMGLALEIQDLVVLESISSFLIKKLNTIDIWEGTNNKAELSAVLDAMTLLDAEEIDHNIPVVVCTDSQYVVGILTKNWKAKANKDIIFPLRAEVKKWNDITIRWVAGHADIPENDEADRLANLAISEGRS